jgi:hypothetical protein
VRLPGDKNMVRENWDKEINELEDYFKSAQIPEGDYKLSQCETIKNIQVFISSHLQTVKAQNGKPYFRPYLERLKKLKEKL